MSDGGAVLTCRIAVVVPAYRVARQVLSVLAAIPEHVEFVFVVDDCCPENSGQLVREQCTDSRVTVLTHDSNRGVGGAMVTGYRAAVAVGAEVIVKIDGDGQMDPREIDRFVDPIARGDADYVKGNRFVSLSAVKDMPVIRLIGNSALSFVNKIVTGYWNLMDPTNGYTAIHAEVLKLVPLERIDPRFFFESDLLFRLGLLRAVVVQVPMRSLYADESSNLRVASVLFRFPMKFLTRFARRILLQYFVLDFSLGSVTLVAGAAFTTFGVTFGALRWWQSIRLGEPATSGTVMLAALPLILGVQFLLSTVSHDVASVPRRPLHRDLQRIPSGRG